MTTHLHPKTASALLDVAAGGRAPARPDTAPKLGDKERQQAKQASPDPVPTPKSRDQAGRNPPGKEKTGKNTASKDTASKDTVGKKDERLDEALEETFPASDPPASSQPTAPGPAGDPATKP